MRLEIHARILRAQLKGDPYIRQNQRDQDPGKADRTSFTCLAYHPAEDSVYCGLMGPGKDFLYRYLTQENRFECLGFHAIADPYDAKIHRSLELDNDGVLWAAIGMLHQVDRRELAPGGAIIRYCTQTRKLEKVCIPVPHIYIHSLVLDRERRLLHGVTFTPEKLITYEIDTGRVIDHGQIGSGCVLAQPERPTLDATGRLWCTWGVTPGSLTDSNAHLIRLLCLDPDTNQITFYQHGLPRLGSYDDGHVDGMLTGRDGFVYIGSTLGAFYRLNPETGAVQYLGKPVPGERLTSLAYGPDGAIYLAAGRPNPYVVRFQPGPDLFEVLGLIRDDETGEQAYQIHDMCCTPDGRIFAAEDHLLRSGHLWECRLHSD